MFHSSRWVHRVFLRTLPNYLIIAKVIFIYATLDPCIETLRSSSRSPFHMHHIVEAIPAFIPALLPLSIHLDDLLLDRPSHK